MKADSAKQTGTVEDKSMPGQQCDNMAELVFILDRSGSMQGHENDTIGGFNAMLDKQRQATGDAKLTTVLFDDKYELLHDRLEIDAVKHITEKDYYVRGMTALLDAIGNSINKIVAVRKALATKHDHKQDDGSEKQNVTFVIITDGHENASREFGADQIKSMIRHQEDKYGWEFIYLAANIDAVSTGEQYGIRPDYSKNFRTDSDGIHACYESMSDVMAMKRLAASRARHVLANEDLSWIEKLDVEFEKTQHKT